MMLFLKGLHVVWTLVLVVWMGVNVGYDMRHRGKYGWFRSEFRRMEGLAILSHPGWAVFATAYFWLFHN